MKRFFSIVGKLVLALLCTLILASLFHTQFVLHQLESIGVNIDLSTRIHTSLEDFIGLAPGYGVIIFISLALGLALIHWLHQKTQWPRKWLYPLAGALGLWVAHMAMAPLFHITLIAGARSEFGLICQCLAGAFGGWVFYYTNSASTE